MNSCACKIELIDAFHKDPTVASLVVFIAVVGIFAALLLALYFHLLFAEWLLFPEKRQRISFAMRHPFKYLRWWFVLPKKRKPTPWLSTQPS